MFLATSSLAAPSSTQQIHLALTGAADSMGVSWRTAAAVADPEVEFAPVASNHSSFAKATDTRSYQAYGVVSGYYHHAEMAGLTPGAQYKYRVASSPQWYYFTAARSSTDSMRMVFTGDFGLGGAGPPAEEGQCTADAFATLAADTTVPVDLIWIAGDIAYANMHGALHFEQTWNEWFDALEPAFSKVPVLVSPGNHETYLPALLSTGQQAAVDPEALFASTTGFVYAPGFVENDEHALEAGASGAWNFTAFDSRFKMPSAASGGARNMWYSVDQGGVHFVSIDTETDFPGCAESFLDGWGDQLAWLKTDLTKFRQSSPDGWLVVVGHKPMYSSAPG
jgi:hypothetical protein